MLGSIQGEEVCMSRGRLSVHVTRGPTPSPSLTSAKDESAFLAYIPTNKSPLSRLIQGTCSDPGIRNAIDGPEADTRGRKGALLASPLPSQMAQLLGGRGSFLERCDYTAKGLIKRGEQKC